jgi:hypothetical protein
VSTGSIGSQVGSVTLTIQPSERIAGSTNRRITISFITVTSLPTGGSITINYPSGFFKSGVIPFVVGANTNIIDTSSFSETSIFLYVCAPVVAGTIVVTLGGVTLGPVTSGSLGISVSTSMDYVSSGVSTGSITASSQITGVILTINSIDRVAGASSKTITLTFKTSTRHPSGSKITLVYPPAFFGSGISPTSIVSGYSFATGSVFEASSIILNLLNTEINAATTLAITLSGVKMGPPMSEKTAGIYVETSEDDASPGVTSGTIGGQVGGVSLTINAADRVSGASGKAVTFALKTANLDGSALASGGKITLSYPSGFFMAGVTPTAVSSLTFSISQFGTNSIVLTLSSTLAKNTAVTITLNGVTMGQSTPGSTTGITVSTSQDYSNSVFLGHPEKQSRSL